MTLLMGFRHMLDAPWVTCAQVAPLPGAEPCGSAGTPDDALSFLLSITEDCSNTAASAPAAPPATGGIKSASMPKKDALHEVQHLPE